MADHTTILVLLPIIVLSMATTTDCSWISGGAPPPVKVGEYPNDDLDLEEAADEFIVQEKETADDTFVIQGKVYCDPCRIQIPTKISYALAGTKVTLVCHKAENDEESYRVEGVSDEKGKYTLNVVGDHAEEICEIIVSESPDPNCPELMDDENHVRVSLTNKHGIKGKGRYANPLGFMSTNADPRCKEALDELGFTGI